ncbi:MAG: GntR family transcriptional regulator [Lentisphaeria bacterium]|nr:GntR family transcriptional regulator [Lentisphaeria bacterium]
MAAIYNRTSGDPLYQELANRIGEDILSSGLRDGDLYCTMKSLCRKFDVSFITVRNAVALLEEHGVVVCRSAVGICVCNVEKLKLIHSFGKIVLILSAHKYTEIHPYYSLRLSAMLQTLAQKGFLAKIYSRDETTPEKLEMAGHFTRGIISSSDYYDLVQNNCPYLNSVPKVFFHHADTLPVSCKYSGFVINDIEAQDELCLKYLKQLDCNQVVFVHSAETSFSGSVRKYFGDRISEITYDTLPSVETGRNIAAKLLALPDDTAFLIEDDYVAVGIHETAVNCGVDLIKSRRVLLKSSPLFSVTEQIGFPVIGFSPIDVGTAAAEKLIRMMENSEVSGNCLITPAGNRNVSGWYVLRL